jgi:hypothetical protein
MRSKQNVARIGESGNVYRALVENLREGYHLEDAVVDGRIILRRIFRKWDGGHELD